MSSESVEEQLKLEAKLSRVAAIELARDMVVGAFLFLVLATTATGVWCLAEWLQATTHLDAITVAVLKIVEFVMLCIDALVFVVYLVRTAWRFVTNLFKS